MDTLANFVLEEYQRKHLAKRQHIDVMIKARQLMRYTEENSEMYRDAEEIYQRHKNMLRQKLHDDAVGDFRHTVCPKDIQEIEQIENISKPNIPSKPMGHNIARNAQGATGGPDDTYDRSPEDDIADQERDIEAILNKDVTRDKYDCIKYRHNMRKNKTPGSEYLDDLIWKYERNLLTETTRKHHHYQMALKAEIDPADRGYRKENRSTAEKKLSMDRIRDTVDALLHHVGPNKRLMALRLMRELTNKAFHHTIDMTTAFEIKRYIEAAMEGIPFHEQMTETEKENMRKEIDEGQLKWYNTMMFDAGVAEAKRRIEPTLPESRFLRKNEYEGVITELKLEMDDIIKPAFNDIDQENRFKALIGRVFIKGMLRLQDIQQFTKDILEQKKNKQPLFDVMERYKEKVYKAPPLQNYFTSPQKDTNQVTVRRETFV